jgi:ribose transport system substrate-binding protein
MLSGIQVLRAAATAALALCASAAFAQASIVSGPPSDPTCMVPWKNDTKFVKYPKKNGPYRIALVNGYIANTWRIQMIKTAKAYTAQPAVAAKLKEFKVVSTGEDVPAQISAVNNFIDAGYDAIIVDAQNPASFGPAIRRAKKAGVVRSTVKTPSTSTSTSTGSACCGPSGSRATCRTEARCSRSAGWRARRSTLTGTMASRTR